MVSDVAYIGSKVSWIAALLLGAVSFTLFYFILPAWIGSHIEAQQGSQFYPLMNALFARRLHWLEWVGIACGLVGLYFAARNYGLGVGARRNERTLVSILARIFGRSIG